MSDASRTLTVMNEVTLDNERAREVLTVITRLYEDARTRTDVIRGIALAAMGVLSVLAALADPKSIAKLGVWAAPSLLLIGAGLVSALAVLLKTPVMVPYDSLNLTRAARESAHDMTNDMLTAVTKAEVYTRTYNNRAAALVNITLTTFVAAVVLLVFQVAVGPRTGLIVGGSSAALVIASAFLVRRHAFVMPAKKGTEHE